MYSSSAATRDRIITMPRSLQSSPEMISPPRRRGRDRALSATPVSWPEMQSSPLPSARWPWWLFPALVLAVAGAILLPLALGVYFGWHERMNYLQTQAMEHFQQALTYESENY